MAILSHLWVNGSIMVTFFSLMGQKGKFRKTSLIENESIGQIGRKSSNAHSKCLKIS